MEKFTKIHRIVILFYIFGLLLYTLVALDHFSQPPLFGLIGLGSIASSTFILLKSPGTEAASYKNIIIGYLIAICVGVTFQNIIAYFDPHEGIRMPIFFQALASLSVLTVIGLFNVFNINHPPAVGMTLALVIESWHYLTVLVLGSSIVGLLLIPFIFRLPISNTHNKQ